MKRPEFYEVCDTIEWLENRIEELEAENARLTKRIEELVKEGAAMLREHRQRLEALRKELNRYRG